MLSTLSLSCRINFIRIHTSANYKFITATKHTDETEQLLHTWRAQSVYLITYSQADLSRLPTREKFATDVVNAFNEGKVKVKSWVCCREAHKEGGLHYHLAIKLGRAKRWKSIKNRLVAEHGIVMNFLSRHDTYYDAWDYVRKEDNDYAESEEHPNVKTCAPLRTKQLFERGDKTLTNGKHQEKSVLNMQKSKRN